MNEELLGLRLEEAAEILKERGTEPVVIRTDAPRGEKREGNLRVIRVRGNELTVSAFLYGPGEYR